MSKIETNTIAPSTGTTLTLGESGDTVTLGSGATQSGFGGTNTPMFLVSGGSGNQTISHASYTKVEYNQEIIDTDSAFDLTNNKFVVPSGEAGKYQFHAQFYMEDSDSNIQRAIMLMKKIILILDIRN